MTRTQSTLQTQRARLAIMRLIGVAALVACMTALLWWQAKQAQATFPGQISIEDTSVTEGDSGTSEATFGVTLTDPGGDTVTVNYETLDGTATKPDDYQQTSGTLTFGSNEATKTVTVPVNGDTSEEGDENFSVVLQSPQNADLADDIGLGTIVDDDVSTGNQVPLATDDSYTINEDNTLNSSVPGVLGNDTDADGTNLRAILLDGPSNGNLTLNADGSFSYTPYENYFGNDSFTYKANDGTDDSNVATVDITINPINDAPVANDDFCFQGLELGCPYKVNEDNTLTVGPGLVLSNDIDADGDSLTAVLVSGPSHGELLFQGLNSDGSFIYRPNRNFSGSDSFTYKANDGTDDSNVATVSITVSPVNDAPTISLPGPALTYTENDPPTVIDPLATVSDLDSPNFENGRLTIAYQLGTGTSNDQLKIRNQGTAAGEIGINGTEVTYGGTTIGSFAGGIGTSSLVINFNANATPEAAQELARNITYSNVSDAPVGGSRRVVFILSDGDDGTIGATKTINLVPVNDAPVNSVPGDQSTNQDTALTFNSDNNNLLSISDVDAGANAVQVRLEATNGKLTLSGSSGLTFASGDSASADNDMTFTGAISNINSALNGLKFDPDANYNGAATLKITTDDQGNTGTGGALSDTDMVNISVNAAPVAHDDDGGTTNEDTPLKILAEDLLANDTDADGDTLSISDFDTKSTQGGTVSLDNGTFTYTPAANYNGPDTFTYKANDGSADSNVATVSITVNSVNDRPTISLPGPALNYTENDPPTVIEPLATVSDPDSPNFAGGRLSVSLGLTDTDPYFLDIRNQGTAAGEIGINGTEVTYGGTTIGFREVGTDPRTLVIRFFSANATPEAAQELVRNITYHNGSDTPSPTPRTVRFTLSDGDGGVGGNATKTINVNPVNDAPVANDDSAATDEDTGTVIDVIANDTDVDNAKADLSVLSGSLSDPANGTAELNSEGKVLYTPDANYNNTAASPDTFTYKVNDGTAHSNAATVSITVNPVDDAPVAAGDSYETNQDTALNVATPGVLGNDTDADGDSLTTVLVSGPSHGTLTLNANGSFTYTPNATYNGSDSFTYRANDGMTASDTATVSITVKPVVDTTAPMVFSVNPSNNQPGVLTTTNITVTFTEKMDESTLNDNTVKLVKPGKKPTSIPVTMAKNTDSNGRTVLTLDPFGLTKQNLAGNTTYQLTIEGAGDGDNFAVKDLAGNQLAQDAVSSFITAKK